MIFNVYTNWTEYKCSVGRDEVGRLREMLLRVSQVGGTQHSQGSNVHRDP